MTSCDDATATASAPCDCESCRTGNLPVRPFEALRVAYGMLLGEDDFNALMGNPRGKQMIHSSWLHGSGVVWGLDVKRSGSWDLTISPGLALDGRGRELHNAATSCVDVRDVAIAAVDASGKDCSSHTIKACLVAEFDTCLASAVPTLADPCDVTRKHDDYSRVVERTKFSLRLAADDCDCCPQAKLPYHRVRVLLGLDKVGHDDQPGHEALDALQEVLEAPPTDRPAVLLRSFRRLVACDSIDLQPAMVTGESHITDVFPAAEDTAVAVACVTITIVSQDGCPAVEIKRVDRHVRRVLLPTSTIQELTCGLAPGLLAENVSDDVEGPRVKNAEATLTEHGTRLTIPVTAPLARGSVAGSVGITSLSVNQAGGWVVEDIYDTRYDRANQVIVVDLADRPVNDLIRVVVKGTGPKPAMGEDPVAPLAGILGGVPGTRFDGHDAVWTFKNMVAPADQRED